MALGDYLHERESRGSKYARGLQLQYFSGYRQVNCQTRVSRKNALVTSAA